MFPRRWRSQKIAVMILTLIMIFIVTYICKALFFMPKHTNLHQEHKKNVERFSDVIDVPILPIHETQRNEVKERSKTAEVGTEQVLFPEDRPLNGYLVYDCTKQHSGLCGGWSDRISGILSTFGLAIISRRHFKIKHNKPCALDGFLEPNNYNWKLDKSEIPIMSEYMYLIDNMSRKIRELALKTKHLENAFKHNITSIRMNWDITHDFRRRPDIAEDFPWITKLQYADIYYGLYHYLFKPGKTVLHEFNNIQKRRKHKLLACSHARAGDPGNKPRDFSNIWRFLSKLDQSKYDIFIASDQQYVRDAGIDALNGYNVITTPGVLGNMDSFSAKCDMFEASMIDFYTVTTCDLLVITQSGFSILAAYVRSTSDNLYCNGDNGVFPCSRNVLEDIYPGNMLAPRLT